MQGLPPTTRTLLSLTHPRPLLARYPRTGFSHSMSCVLRAGFSMQYWYRCVADDPWDWAGLQHFIRERRSAPDLMEIRLLDLLPQLAAGGQVSCLDIRRHQLGPLLYEILIATSPDEDYSV